MNKGTVSQNGTEGRVYGGDCNLIHVADGKRADMGRALATTLDHRMRTAAEFEGRRTHEESLQQDLCPGCYMIVAFNMLTTLAMENGQSMSELGQTMAAAFSQLAEKGAAFDMEEITVMLDR